MVIWHNHGGRGSIPTFEDKYIYIYIYNYIYLFVFHHSFSLGFFPTHKPYGGKNPIVIPTIQPGAKISLFHVQELDY